MKSIADAANYLATTLLQHDFVAAPDAIEDEIRDRILARIDDQLTPEHLLALESHEEKNPDDTEFAETYLSQKIPNFFTLLSEITSEMVIEFLESQKSELPDENYDENPIPQNNLT